ncbi:MAG: hypothetical protein L0211_22400 [Planctomycetaceae bacterium]|nr:hypothetical protein [Planctomycetaceae bacterium]
MKSRLHEDFLACFRGLPDEIKELARKKYKLWAADPHHPSLHFKRVGEKKPIYSVRIGIGWRALGLVEGDTITWFWIGSHAEYDRLIST